MAEEVRVLSGLEALAYFAARQVAAAAEAAIAEHGRFILSACTGCWLNLHSGSR